MLMVVVARGRESQARWRFRLGRRRGEGAGGPHVEGDDAEAQRVALVRLKGGGDGQVRRRVAVQNVDELLLLARADHDGAALAGGGTGAGGRWRGESGACLRA